MIPIPILCFAIASVAMLLLLLKASTVGYLAAVLISLGVFVLLHILFFLFFWAASLAVPKDKPLEKQNALCRFGTAYIIETLNWYAGVRPVIRGIEKLPKEGRFLYVCNHRSMFDPLVVMDKLRVYNISFISKPSNMELPFAGRIAYADGFLAIDRENNRNALKTILAAADYLKRDICSIGIYPEGTRSKTKEMLPFHAGSFKIAQQAGVPVVVASIQGSEKVKLVRLFSTTPVYLNILEVIPAEKVCSMRTDELAETVREIIQRDLDKSETEN